MGPYVELEMIRDMIPQIEPLPIAIPIAAPIAIPSKYHKYSHKNYLRNPYPQFHNFIAMQNPDEDMLMSLTAQLSQQVSDGANTNTIEHNSITFEYKVGKVSKRSLISAIKKNLRVVQDAYNCSGNYG